MISDRQYYLTFYENFIFKANSNESIKSYQIVLQSSIRNELVRIQLQTGLSVSEIMKICFIYKDN